MKRSNSATHRAGSLFLDKSLIQLEYKFSKEVNLINSGPNWKTGMNEYCKENHLLRKTPNRALVYPTQSILYVLKYQICQSF